MPKLEFFVVSESVAVDQATNEASIFNIIEEITPEHFPTLVPKCAVTSLWLAQPDDADKDFQAITRIVAPGGQVQEVRTNFRMVRRRHRVINYILGIPISSPGELVFELLLNGEHAAEHRVSVDRPE